MCVCVCVCMTCMGLGSLNVYIILLLIQATVLKLDGIHSESVHDFVCVCMFSSVVCVYWAVKGGYPLGFQR